MQQQDFMKSFETGKEAYAEMSKNALLATRELVEISARVMGKAIETQVSFAYMMMDNFGKQLDVAKDVTDAKSFVAKETAFVEECAGKISEVAQTQVKLVQEAGEELKSWFEKGVKTADLTVKEVTKTAVKSAPKVRTTTAAKKPAATTEAA